MPNKERIKELKEQLINVLQEMDKIKPVQFHDTDCDDCVFNFSDVRIDEVDNRVYIELAMWHDNLPAHQEKPLFTKGGVALLSENSDDINAQIIYDVRLVKHGREIDASQEFAIAKKISRAGLISALCSKAAPSVTTRSNESLYLEYSFNGEEFSVSITNNTSDVIDEWFDYDYCEDIVKASILDGKDYVIEYNDAKLRARENGKELTQQEFLSTYNK